MGHRRKPDAELANSHDPPEYHLTHRSDLVVRNKAIPTMAESHCQSSFARCLVQLQAHPRPEPDLLPPIEKTSLDAV